MEGEQTPTAQPEEWVSIREYARRRGCSEAWVRAAIDRGQLGRALRIGENGRPWIHPAAADANWPRSAHEGRKGRRAALPRPRPKLAPAPQPSPPQGLSLRGYARHRGVSAPAVSKAIATGRIASAVTRAGRKVYVDVELADRLWDRNTDPAQRRAAADASLAAPAQQPASGETIAVAGETIAAAAAHDPTPAEAPRPAVTTALGPPALTHPRLLQTAPWDLADAELVPAADACTTCPKNSANAKTLFDQGQDPVCQDAGCWSRKAAAHQLRLDQQIEQEAAAALEQKRSDLLSPTQQAFAEVKVAQAELQIRLDRIKLAQLCDRLSRVEDVRRAAADASQRLGVAILAIPDRLATVLAAETDPAKVHQVLSDELRTTLEASSHEIRPAAAQAA